VIPALAREADILFTRAVFRREDIEAAVAEFEAARVDALLVILVTYSPANWPCQFCNARACPS